MYENHFGFREKPFSLMPDPDFLYLSIEHENALAMLEYGLHEQTGVTVVTGEVGSGKTTLVRHLLRQMDDREFTVGLISHTRRNYGDVLHWVASAFDLPHQDRDAVTLYRDLEKFFIQEYAQGHRAVLIIDEAQNFDENGLEEIRLLSNINSDKDHLVQIILVGQPQLFELLQKRELFQLAQRVSAEYHLEPLTSLDTMKYIQHRLSVAGGKKDTFDGSAMYTIYYFSAGIPRLINTLCDLCLAYAYGSNDTKVQSDTVLDVVRSKRIYAVLRLRDQMPETVNARIILKQLLGFDVDQAVAEAGVDD